MASGDDDPRETLRRIHPDHCGTPNGYQQIARARAALTRPKPFRRLAPGETIDGLPLPEYDDECKAAWRAYIKRRRRAGGRLGLPPGPPPILNADHGTIQRFRQHVKERRSLRVRGVPESQIPPICQACRDAWRTYNAQLKKRRAVEPEVDNRRGDRQAKRGTATVEIPSPWSSCGTDEGIREHYRQRIRQRDAGEPLSPYCDKCRTEKLRRKVLRRINRVRARKGT